jgi:hypothetical protein
VGFIDSTGKIIINPIYDDGDKIFKLYYMYGMDEGDMYYSNKFFDDRCKVSLNHKFGIIDINGNVILPFEYQHIYYEFYDTQIRKVKLKKLKPWISRATRRFLIKQEKNKGIKKIPSQSARDFFVLWGGSLKTSPYPLRHRSKSWHTRGTFYIIPSIPPGIPPCMCGLSSSGSSANIQSVVKSIEATEAAFSRATRPTFVGSITPAAIRFS